MSRTIVFAASVRAILHGGARGQRPARRNKQHDFTFWRGHFLLHQFANPFDRKCCTAQIRRIANYDGSNEVRLIRFDRRGNRIAVG